MHTVVNNPVGAFDLTTYKLASPGQRAGLDLHRRRLCRRRTDRPAPRADPAHRPGRERGRAGRPRSRRAQIADESSIGLPGNVSSVVPFAVADTGVAALRGVGGDISGLMCLELDVRERPVPLQLCNRYFGDRLIPGAVQGEMALDAEIATSLVDELAARRPIHLDSVRVDMALRRGARLLELERARGPKRVRRGQRIRVRATARQARGEARSLRLRVRVPRKLRRGRYRLLLTGGASASSFELFGFEGAVSLERLFARLLSADGARAAQDEEEAERVPITNFKELEKRLVEAAALPRHPRPVRSRLGGGGERSARGARGVVRRPRRRQRAEGSARLPRSAARHRRQRRLPPEGRRAAALHVANATKLDLPPWRSWWTRGHCLQRRTRPVAACASGCACAGRATLGALTRVPGRSVARHARAGRRGSRLHLLQPA